jgi:hypothetical protein
MAAAGSAHVTLPKEDYCLLRCDVVPFGIKVSEEKSDSLFRGEYHIKRQGFFNVL